ncbi:hypothetical protein FG386_003327 [Cryptosporidium ryanae]|uniref:uncharacterized protein n=1 Tax=Cryptosporidium ryanae TaxID=515981 RepID=UPI00351A63F8|nr:hypothetical protein FG386_003327 [Cryptosporidium ryanae]
MVRVREKKNRILLGFMGWLFVYLFAFLINGVVYGSDVDEIYREEIKKSLKRQKMVKKQVMVERSKLVSEMEALLCNKNKFSFIECEYDSSNAVMSFGGMFGVGISAILYPANTAFRVYKNCKIDADLSYKCFEKDLLTNSEGIRVFIKRENSKLLTQYKHAYLDKLPIVIPNKIGREFNIGFLMEKYMTSYLSSKKTLNNHISPDVYTITTKWGSPIVEFDRFIFMQFLDGVTLSELLRKLRQSEIYHMKNSFRKVLRAYGNLVAARSTQNKNIDSIKRREMLLRISINNSAGEILGRLRYRLSILDHTLNFLQRIWEQNIYHCDLCHPNIMILDEYLTDPIEITKIIRDGQGFLIDDDQYINMMEVNSLPLEITKRLDEKNDLLNQFDSENGYNENNCPNNDIQKPNLQNNDYDNKEDDSKDNSYSKSNTPDNSLTFGSNLEETLDNDPKKHKANDAVNSKKKRGLRVIRFRQENFRVIDFSFAVDLTKEMNSYKGVDKYFIETPCRIYRPDRREDIIELRRFVDEAVYHASKTETIILADTWSTVIEELINENSSVSYHVDKFLSHDKSVATQAKQFLTTIQVLQRFFKELRNNIYGPEWTGCWENFNEWRKLKLVNKFDQMEREQLKFQSSCNIKDMTIAIHKAREQIHHHINRFKQGLLGSTLVDASSTMDHYYSISTAPLYIEKKLRDIIENDLFKLS